jgi:hypothetical protein
LGKYSAIVSLMLLPLFACATPPANGVKWGKWSFMLGTWEAVGKGFRTPHPNAAVDSFSFALDTTKNQIVWTRHQSHFAYDGPVTITDQRTVIEAGKDGRLSAVSQGKIGSESFYGIDGKRHPGGWHDISARYNVELSPGDDSLFFWGDSAAHKSPETCVFVKMAPDTLWLVSGVRLGPAPGRDIRRTSIEIIARVAGKLH